MAEKLGPPYRAQLLGRKLRRLREVAAMTGDDVASRLGWSASKVSRLETGATVIEAGDLERLLDLYGTSDLEREQLSELRLKAQQRGWWEAYADTLRPEVVRLMELEDDAESICWYHPTVVPGLLQTEEYARAVIHGDLHMAPSPRIERRVQVRARSQRILYRDVPPELTVVLDEAVISRAIGGREVLRAQVIHLLKLAESGKLTLQVLPFAIGAHPALTGGFEILRFAEPLPADVVYLESKTSDLFVEDEAEVYRYIVTFDQVRNLALGTEESKVFLSKAAGIDKP